MKKALLVFAAIGLLTAIPSCKKGANDPFLSLKGRKARLAGEYEIANMFSTTFSKDSDDNETTVTTDIEDGVGKRTTTWDNPDSDPTTTIRDIVVNDGTFIIEKDGSWARTFNLTMTWTEDGDDFFIDHTDYTQVTTLEESGSWSFLGGQAEEFKKKERVALNVIMTESTEQTTSKTFYTDESTSTDEGPLFEDQTTFAEGANSVIYAIDMLKNKEMIFVQDLDMEDEQLYDFDGVIYSYSMTRTGNTEIRFIQN